MEDPVEVREGLVMAEDAAKFYELRATAAETRTVEDALALAAYARDLCADNPMLFGLYFLGLDPAPHIWRLWLKYRNHKKLLLRLSRGHGKSENWTVPTLIHRICYHFVEGSKYIHWSTMIGLESKEKCSEIMRAVQKPLESGGVGGILNLAFYAIHNGERLTIPEYVQAVKGDWSKNAIDFRFIDGASRKEPVLRAFTVGSSGVAGVWADEFLFDDFVAEKGAKSPVMRKGVRRYFTQTVGAMVFDPDIPVLYIHTLYHPEDQSRTIQATGLFQLIEVNALNRFPTNRDFHFVEAAGGQRRVELTEHARDLVPLWPCPSGPEAECPATKRHKQEVGFHRPVKELIYRWKADPMMFSQQYMNKPHAGDEASVKPYMMRFYVTSPNHPDLGKVASYHKDWSDFVEEANRAGVPIDSEPPRIVAFPFTKTDHSELAWHGQAWDLSYGKNTESTDETVACTRYRHRDGRVFHRFEAGRWRHGTTMKKVCLATTTDPVAPVREVGLPGGGTESKVSEAVDETRRRLKLDHQFQVKSFTRHRSKDEVFHQSGYAAELANGLGYFDLDDDVTIRQFLSVTPDETGGHDDRWDAAIYAKQLDPLTTGGGFFMVSLD